MAKAHVIFESFFSDTWLKMFQWFGNDNVHNIQALQDLTSPYKCTKSTKIGKSLHPLLVFKLLLFCYTIVLSHILQSYCYLSNTYESVMNLPIPLAIGSFLGHIVTSLYQYAL